MAVISGWWPSVNGDRKYYIEQQAAVNAQIYSNGVLPVGSQLRVTSVSGLEINVTAGFAWVNGYWIYNDADYALQVDAPDGVFGRVDRVVVRWLRDSRDVVFAVKKGAASSTPAGAALQQNDDVYELCLAEITVDAGAASITQTAIRDTRPDAALCGFSAVYDPPIATEWFAQFEASFIEWFNTVKGILEGDVAAELAGAVGQLRTDVNALQKNSLPEVTTGDNGKFLRVVNGAWASVSVVNAEGVSY